MSRAWVLALAWGVSAGCSGNDFQQDDANAGEAGELGAGEGGSSSAGEGGEASGGSPVTTSGTGGSGGGADDGGEAGEPSGGTGGSQTGTGGSGDAGGVGGTAGDPGQGGVPVAGAAGSDPAGTPGIGGDASSGSGGLFGAGGIGTSGSPSVAGASGAPACSTPFGMDWTGYVTAPAIGICWGGYAFATGDATSTVTFPGGGTDFSRAKGELGISGTVGKAIEPDYLGSVHFGFAIGQIEQSSTTETVVPAGTSVTVECTGCADPPMLVELVGARVWCAPLTSGAAIPYATFRTGCQGAVGAAYAGEPLEAIHIRIPGGDEDATFDVTITGLVEN